MRLTRFSELSVKAGSQRMLGFRGELVTNVSWSPWVGLGKMVSKGFGLLEAM